MANDTLKAKEVHMKTARHTRFNFAAFAALALIASLTLANCGGGGGSGGGSAPAATWPTGVNAVAESTSQINITWTTVTGATGYNVYTSRWRGTLLFQGGGISPPFFNCPASYR